MRIALITEQVFTHRVLKFGVSADFDLAVVNVNRREIFGEAFVEPSLHRGVVEAEKAKGEVVGDGPPRFLLEKVENDEILIVAGQVETRDGDRLSLTQGGDLVIGLVVFECEDGERTRFVEVIFSEESGEDGAHLLETKGDLAASLFAGVGDDGVVNGMQLQPRRLGSASRKRQREKQESEVMRDGTCADHRSVTAGEALTKC